ncbi:MAG: NADAR family protein [Caldilineaceae bacterium]|nr:NADAR family protein [Caldilineaceae bacterium]
MPIRFYLSKDPYYELTNHSAHGFTLDGHFWPTVEHYYQAQKFAGSAYADAIRDAPNPMIARRMGRDREHPIRPDWDAVKEAVMYRATLAKFESHPDALASLLSTGEEELVEASPRDFYWGSGADGSGLNRYGQILMQVRALLRSGRGETPKE